MLMKYYLLVLTCCLIACTSTPVSDKGKEIYIEDMEKCVDFKMLFPENTSYIATPLTIDSCCTPYIGMKLQIENNDFLLGDSQFAHVVYRYDSMGRFMNMIGKRGYGPEEYSALKDFIVSNDTISIVSLGSPGDCIYRYKDSGEFLGKIEIPKKIVSLARNASGEYIVNSGRNIYNSSWQITHYSSDWSVLEEYFELSSDGSNVPVMESNFSVDRDKVFYHEAFNNQLYVLEESLKPSYSIMFDGVENFHNVHEGDFVKAIERLYKQGFYLVDSYLESDKLLFLVMSYLKDSRTQKQVLLVYDKEQNIGQRYETEQEDLYIGNLCIENDILYCMAPENFVRRYVPNDWTPESDMYILKIKL